MSGFPAAVAFLTRIPLGRGDRNLEGAAPWFPWVGVAIGSVVAGIYAAAHGWVPSTLGAVIAVSAGVFLTGAMHEDGLADTTDAFGSGASGEEALQILRDPRLGTYGVIAVAVSLVWRILALASLSPDWAVAGLILAHGVGRSGAVMLAAIAPPARREGLGRSAVVEMRPLDAVVVVVSALVIGAASAGWWAIPVLVLTAFSLWWWRRVALRRIAGVTGDVLGACEQVTELLALTTIAVAAWGGASPWWGETVL
ncbi:MAG TPA: adenosylcobinamide-GDP ribazoletransferase [Acidimicrobiia bacterium]|nr:adenosylcobinamide-GDP ribazoletransferase [Acidimicrobiia bacterium]